MSKSHLNAPHFLNREIAKRCGPIISLTRAAEPDIGKIIKQIDDVQVFAHRILRITNSAVVGLQKTVTSVEQAVALLGPRRVRIIMEQLQAELGRTGSEAATTSRRS